MKAFRRTRGLSRLYHQLHRDGYVVFRQHIKFPKRFDSHCTGQFEVIFNYANRQREDHQRTQRPYTAPSTVSYQIRDLVTRLLGENRQLNDWVVIRSSDACQEQHTHTDVDSKRVSQRGEVPCSLLLGLEPNSKLKVWPRSLRGIITPGTKPCTLRYGKGDVVIFRGDLVHCGSAYDRVNYRVHCFIDTPDFTRIQNVTHLIRP